MKSVTDHSIATAANLAEHARSYALPLANERCDPEEIRGAQLAQDQGVALRSVIAYGAAAITEALCAIAEASKR